MSLTLVGGLFWPWFCISWPYLAGQMINATKIQHKGISATTNLQRVQSVKPSLVYYQDSAVEQPISSHTGYAAVQHNPPTKNTQYEEKSLLPFSMNRCHCNEETAQHQLKFESCISRCRTIAGHGNSCGCDF